MCNSVTAPQLSHSVVSDSLRPYGRKSTRLLRLWDSSGKNTGVGCHVPLQGILQTQGLNLRLLRLLHWQVGSLPLAPRDYTIIWCQLVEIERGKSNGVFPVFGITDPNWRGSFPSVGFPVVILPTLLWDYLGAEAWGNKGEKGRGLYICLQHLGGSVPAPWARMRGLPLKLSVCANAHFWVVSCTVFRPSVPEEKMVNSLLILWYFIYFWHTTWDLSSPTRDLTCAPCRGSLES